MTSSDLDAVRLPLRAVAAAIRRHPRRLAAAVTTLLAGTALTAFGVAPLVPDAEQMPKTMVTETVDVEGLSAQVETLARTGLEFSRSTISRSHDGAEALMRRLGVQDPLAVAFLRQDAKARRLVDGEAGRMLEARTARDGTLLELVARYAVSEDLLQSTHFARLTVRRDAGRFTSELETVPLQRQLALGAGRVRSTLWEAVDAAHLPEEVAEQMIEIFSGDIDFHHELRRGDTFSVVYERLQADGRPVAWSDGMGRIVAAQFVNHGERFEAVWYQDAASGKGAYFGFDGKARRRAFLASPMEFSRITSGFEMRMHPILHRVKAHHGIDYGAPTGTPVKSVGNGVVETAARQNGYGNVVFIDHGGDRKTVYAHLSAMQVRPGQRVEQGQVIGLVGATGMATGPHLHFEFRERGEFKDPQVVARATETLTVDSAARPQFLRTAGVVRRQLDAASTMQRFRGDAE